MQTKLFFRLALMTGALVGTLLTIYQLKKPTGVAPLERAASPETVRVAKVTSYPPFFWCVNRVGSIKFNGLGHAGVEIAQSSRRWLETKSERELNFLEVEKWFGRFCSVKVDQVSSLSGFESKAEEFAPALEVHFIDGNLKRFEKSKNGWWRVNNTIFRSQEFDQGILSLSKLLPVGLSQ